MTENISYLTIENIFYEKKYIVFLFNLSLAMLSKPLMTEVTTSSSSLMRPPWLVLKVRVWPTSAIEDTCEASTVEATRDPIRNTLVGLVAIAWGNKE